MFKLSKSMILAMITTLVSMAILLQSNNLQAQVVRYSEVSEQTLQDNKRVLGTLKAYQQTNIAAAQAGIITSTLANDGDNVKKGDLLIQLDDRKLKAQQQRITSNLAIAQASFELAKAEFEQAEYDYAAYQQSASKHAISEQRLRQSKTLAITKQAQVIIAQEQIQGLQAELNDIALRIEEMAIRAPFSGQITKRNAELGQWLSVGDIALTLTSLDKLEAWIDVPERLASQTTAQLNSIALQVGDHLLTGENVKVINAVDNRARTFQVISQLSASGLMPGMSVSAWLPEGQSQTHLTVPKDALVKRGNNHIVYKVTSQNDQQNAAPVIVNVLFHQGNVVAISTPQLAAGDKVITEGNERLMPGPVIAVADTPVNQVASKATSSALK